MLSVMMSVCCCLSLSACGKKKDNDDNNNNVVPKTESVNLIDREVTVYVGGTYKFEPTGANSFTYVSSNQSVAKVSEGGVLTGMADGTAFVDVSAGSAKVTCKVNVIKAENYIRFNAANHYAVIGGDVTVKAQTILKGKETSDKVEFSCDTTDGITIVKSGDNEITATVTKSGEYKIIAKSGDLTAECTIKAVSASATMLASPVLKVEDCATLTWAGVKNAGAYAVSVNGGKEVVVTDTSFDVYEYTADLKYGDKAVFSVKAIVSDDDFEHIDGVSSSIDFAHNYEETVVTEHNCQVAGESDFTCLSCGKTYVEKARLSDHKYVDGVCVNVIDENGTVCGFEQTAKVGYKYDGHNDCYFVEGPDAGYDSEDLYIRAKYNDGNPAHGEKQVKYMALGAFKNNNVVKRVYLPASMTEFKDNDPKFVYSFDSSRSLNDVDGMNGKSSPLKGNVFEGCTSLEFVSMPGVHTLPAVAESIYAHWNFRDCYNLKTIVVPAGFENRGAGFMRWDNTPDNAENLVDVYVLYSGGDKDGNHITGKVNRICDASSYPIGSDVGYGNNTLLTGDVFEYDDNATSDTCFKWKYDENGDVISGGKHDFNGKNFCRKCGAKNDLGVAYGYDKDYVIGKDEKGNDTKGAYYVADNRGLALETVEILPTYNDGVHGELPVKFVYHGAFQGNPFIKKVILPESVTSLDGNVFALCENLEYISMPGVTDLNYKEFTRSVYGSENHDTGNNFLDCYSLKTIIVNKAFTFNCGQFTGREIEVSSSTDKTQKTAEATLSAVRGEAVIYSLGDDLITINPYVNWDKNVDSYKIKRTFYDVDQKVLKQTAYYGENKTEKDGKTIVGYVLLKVVDYKADGKTVDKTTLYDKNGKTTAQDIFAETYLTPSNNILSGDVYYYGKLNRCKKWNYDGEYIVRSDSAHDMVDGVCKNCGEKDAMGVIYSYDANSDSYYVADYTGSYETVRIHGTWDDGEHGEKAVTFVKFCAFDGNADIKKVILHENITALDGSVFANCPNLEYVSMTGVTELKAVELHSLPHKSIYPVNDLTNNNFLNCGKLTTVVVGKNFTVGDGMFKIFNKPEYSACVNIYTLATGEADGTITLNKDGNNALLTGNICYYGVNWKYAEDGFVGELS